MPPTNDDKLGDGAVLHVEDGAKFTKDEDGVALQQAGASQKLIGLTKEQLEKYRNDPFWKFIRILLFVLFWAAWLLMFAGAIIIVVTSPKCSSSSKDEAKWWQQKTSYQVLTPTFFDASGSGSEPDGVGDFAGIVDKLDKLRKIGVTSLLVSPVLATSRNEFFDAANVIDHSTVDERFGGPDGFKTLVDAAQHQGIHLVVDFPLSVASHEHKWTRESDASTRFVTAAPGSAAYSDPRFQKLKNSSLDTRFLRGPSEGQIVVNWANQNVRNELLAAIRRLLDLGVDGFHFDHLSYLSLDAAGNVDKAKVVPTVKSLSEEIDSIISSNEALRDKDILLYTSARDLKDERVQLVSAGRLHSVLNDDVARLTAADCKTGVAACLQTAIEKASTEYAENGLNPVWAFDGADSARLATRFPNAAELLTFTQLALPGAVQLYYGQEIGLRDADIEPASRGVMRWSKDAPHHGFTSLAASSKLFFPEGAPAVDGESWDEQWSAESSPLKTVRSLAKLRLRSDTLTSGQITWAPAQSDLLAFSRYQLNNGTVGNEIFVLAANFGTATEQVSKSVLDQVVPPNGKLADSCEVSAVTTGLVADSESPLHVRSRVNAAGGLALPPSQAILLKC